MNKNKNERIIKKNIMQTKLNKSYFITYVQSTSVLDTYKTHN